MYVCMCLCVYTIFLQELNRRQIISNWPSGKVLVNGPGNWS